MAFYKGRTVRVPPFLIQTGRLGIHQSICGTLWVKICSKREERAIMQQSHDYENVFRFSRDITCIVTQ